MTTENYALVCLYHPVGAKVTVPISPENGITDAQALLLVKSVDALIAAGFTVNLPGLMDGETVEQIGFAVRREKANDDSTSTPVMDVYPVNGNFRILGLYLNAPDDVRNFETATGLRLDAMPLYDGSPIERGKNPRLDRFVCTVKTAAKLVFKLNPKWEGDEDKKHSKRMFVRWDGLRPQAEVETTVAVPSMTLEAAKVCLTPGGLRIGGLTDDKLHQLAHSFAANVTDEMRDAANIMLQTQGESDAIPATTN